MKSIYALDFEDYSFIHKEAEKNRGYSPGERLKTITGNLYQPTAGAAEKRLAMVPSRTWKCVNADFPQAACPQISPQKHCWHLQTTYDHCCLW